MMLMCRDEDSNLPVRREGKKDPRYLPVGNLHKVIIKDPLASSSFLIT
jgi:hypothetical protein